jgi:hypothetical protein
MEVLQSAVCKHYNVSPTELHSKSRKMEIVGARRMFFFFARKHFNKTYTSIANMFGANHATVMHHEKKMIGYLEFDKLEMLRYIKIRDMVFEEKTFINIRDEYDCLNREKIIIEDRMKEIQDEINLINNKNEFKYGN